MKGEYIFLLFRLIFEIVLGNFFYAMTKNVKSLRTNSFFENYVLKTYILMYTPAHKLKIIEIYIN